MAELTAREGAAGYDPAEAAARARALLGSEDELAQSWLSNLRLKSLTARAPWAALPILLAIFTMVGSAVWIPVSIGAAKTVRALSAEGLVPPAAYTQFSSSLSQSASFMTPPLIVLVMALLIRRQRLNPAWLLIPVLVLIALGLRFHIALSPHDASVGAGLSAPRCLRTGCRTFPCQSLCCKQ